jgi:DNA transposition AAA+ family ATPase
MIDEKRKKQVLEALNSHLEKGANITGNDNPYSAARLAKTLNISSALISQIKNGNWNNISDAVWNQLAAHFRVDGWRVVTTENYVSISKLCEDAQQNHRLLAISGYTGAGKTKTLTHYTDKNANVFYVLCNRLMTQKSFLQEILKSMGLDYHGSKQELMNGIINYMRGNANCLLILDDFAKVTDNIYQLIQQIYDETVDKGVGGMVIAGTEYLKQHIDQKASKNKLGFRELRRRIGYWQSLKRPTKRNVEAIVKHNLDEVSDKEIEYVFNQIKNKDFGTLREFVINYQRALMSAKGLDKLEVLQSIKIGDMNYSEV